LLSTFGLRPRVQIRRSGLKQRGARRRYMERVVQLAWPPRCRRASYATGWSLSASSSSLRNASHSRSPYSRSTPLDETPAPDEQREGRPGRAARVSTRRRARACLVKSGSVLSDGAECRFGRNATAPDRRFRSLIRARSLEVPAVGGERKTERITIRWDAGGPKLVWEWREFCAAGGGASLARHSTDAYTTRFTSLDGSGD
jgi:hypothetical protein